MSEKDFRPRGGFRFPTTPKWMIGLVCFGAATPCFATETGKGSPATSAAPQSVAEIQACLDKKRKSRYEANLNKPNAPVVATAPPAVSPYKFHLVSDSELPAAGCETGDLDQLKIALNRQLENCAKTLSGSQARLTKQLGCRLFQRQEWCSDTNSQLLKLANKSSSFGEFTSSARKQFAWYKSDGQLDDGAPGSFKKGESQFTAYYTSPTVDASAQRVPPFTYPVYAKVDGLTHVSDADPRSCGNDPVTGGKINWCVQRKDGTLGLAPTRAESAETGNPNHLKPLYYLKDPIDIAFMMIQGSGKIRVINPSREKACRGISSTECGTEMRLNYDGQNGRARNMPASVMSCMTGTVQADWQSEEGIRKYMAAHPDEMMMILNLDQTMVYFKPVTDQTGATGADGFPVTGHYSFATDRSVIPPGAATLFNVSKPKGFPGECARVTSLALSQDTGGAIKGAHVDWYLGDGPEVKQQANDFNVGGELFIAVPKGAGQTIDGCRAQ